MEVKTLVRPKNFLLGIHPARTTCSHVLNAQLQICLLKVKLIDKHTKNGKR